MTLFFFHWYTGVEPPLTGVAVKVTLAPEHEGFADAAIETVDGTIELTVTGNILTAEFVYVTLMLCDPEVFQVTVAVLFADEPPAVIVPPITDHE